MVLLDVSFFFLSLPHFPRPGRERVHSRKSKKFFSQRSAHQMNLSSKWKDRIFISTLISISFLQNKCDMTSALHLLESEDKRDAEKPVNSSIIWCLSCLIKHIIDYLSTNDSHPITHESNGFVITSTWPRCGWTDLRYRVRVYPLFTVIRDYISHRMSLNVALSSAKKQLEGKMQLLQDYHTASVWLFWLNSWIYMNPSCISIWNSPPS